MATNINDGCGCGVGGKSGSHYMYIFSGDLYRLDCGGSFGVIAFGVRINKCYLKSVYAILCVCVFFFLFMISEVVSG